MTINNACQCLFFCMQPSTASELVWTVGVRFRKHCILYITAGVAQHDHSSKVLTYLHPVSFFHLTIRVSISSFYLSWILHQTVYGIIWCHVHYLRRPKTTLFCLISVGGNSCGLSHIEFLVFALVNIILDEFCIVIPNTSSTCVRVLHVR